MFLSKKVRKINDSIYWNLFIKTITLNNTIYINQLGKYVIISVILYIIEKVVNFKSRGIFSGQKFISTYDAAYNTVLYYLNSDSKLDDLKTMVKVRNDDRNL